MQRLRNAWLALLGRPTDENWNLRQENCDLRILAGQHKAEAAKAIHEKIRITETLERKLDTIRAQLRNSGREQVIEECAEWLAKQDYTDAAEVVREMLDD